MTRNPEECCGLAVARAMEANGWTFAAEHGGRRAFVWPFDGSVLVVPVDPAVDGYDNELDAAIEEIAVVAKRGEQARKVLDQLTAEGVIL